MLIVKVWRWRAIIQVISSSDNRIFHAADDTKTALRALSYVDQGMKLANGTGYHKRLFLPMAQAYEW